MVNAMTRYANDRARYDATYIRDVYESVEAASSQFKLPTNTTWPGVATALRDIRVCLSIDANTTPTRRRVTSTGSRSSKATFGRACARIYKGGSGRGFVLGG